MSRLARIAAIATFLLPIVVVNGACNAVPELPGVRARVFQFSGEARMRARASLG